MCWAMADGIQNQEVVPESLRRQLAVAVRSVQWSYAIFWSPSTSQHGVLEWGNGYYNGDIKTRKTVQAMELKADKMNLQRSEQLRELYGCLLEGETEQNAKRLSAALSPDDLTDAEWYFLVCMSFVFNQGEDLSGKALLNGEPIWLCNAHCADSKVFSRSLLAKSASIQTVICFPHLDGVIELGVTDLVLEDPSLIQHIKTSLLELSKPVCSEKSLSAPHKRDGDSDYMYAKVDEEKGNTGALENVYSPIEDVRFDPECLKELEGNIQDDFTMDSPDECSNGCEHNLQREDSVMLQGTNVGVSQVQSWHFVDDDLSNCVQDSMNSSDCISQVFVNQERAISPPKGENVNSLNQLQECNDMKFISLDIGTDDNLHHRRTLSAVLKNSHQLLDSLCFRNLDHKSSFVSWKKGEISRPLVQQKMLKKILIDVPSMHGCCSLKSKQENARDDWEMKAESNEMYVQLTLPDKRIENDKFWVLKSMVPAVSKIDKASILHDTIEYLKELEARVEELESCVDLGEHGAKSRRKSPDMVEQTSENYENGRIGNSNQTWINKRKACDIDENDPNSVVPKDDALLDMKVEIKEQEVLIEMRCPWRDYLLIDIIDAMNNLNLDAHSVQSSTVDGILTVTLQSKFRGAAVTSARMIKQALSTVAGKC